MSWNKLLKSLVKTPTIEDIREPERGVSLLQAIADAEPSIYWYPGSGDDLHLLAYDLPNNRTGRRLFPLKGKKVDARPLLLWMNDCNDSFWGFPNNAIEYRNEQFPAQIKVEGAHCRYVIPTKLYDAQNHNISIPLTVFQVRVTGGKPKRHQRPEKGDLYTVFYSAAEAEMLLSCVFAPHKLRVEVVALVGLGDQQRENFTLFQDVPRRLAQYRAAVGRVQYYLADDGVGEIPGYRLEGMEVNGIRMWVPAEAPPYYPYDPFAPDRDPNPGVMPGPKIDFFGAPWR